MNVTKFSDDAVRLNVSIEVVRSTYEKSLREGKIQGIIVPNGDEFIRFTIDEIDILTSKLGSDRISLNDLATDLKLTINQVRIVFNFLVKEKKVNGALTYDDTFIPNGLLREEVINAVYKNGTLDFHEVTKQLGVVSDNSIILIRDSLSKEVLSSVSTYSKIGLADLALEVKLPESVTKLFLKKLIQDGKLVGQLDMVNNVLTLEKVKPSSKPIEDNQSTLYSRPVYNQPSNAWYIVPFFFGFLGGLISYLIVEKDDHDKAVDLFWFGIIMSIIYVIFAWAYWSWVMSLFRL
jgi:hypothetical protein